MANGRETFLERIAKDREARRARGAENRAAILSARGVTQPTPTAANPVVQRGRTTTSQSQIAQIRNAPRTATRLTGLAADDPRRGKVFNLPTTTPTARVPQTPVAPTRESILAGGDPTPSRQFVRAPQDVDPAQQVANGARGIQEPQFQRSPARGTATPPRGVATQAATGERAPTLGGIRSGVIAAQDSFLDDLLAEQSRLQEEQEDFLADERTRITRRVQEQFAPRFAEARASGARAQETAQRFGAFAGSARGTRAEEQAQLINEKQQQQEAALAAEQAAEIDRQLAIARGASDSELEALGDRISQARTQRIELQRDFELLQAGLDETAVATAATAEKEALTLALNAAKAGLRFNPATQTFERDPNLGDGEDFQVEFFTDNTGNVTQVTTNPRTGESTTNQLGQLGPAKRTGGGGGTGGGNIGQIITQLRGEGRSEQEIANVIDQLTTTSQLPGALTQQFLTQPAPQASPLAGLLGTLFPQVQAALPQPQRTFPIPERQPAQVIGVDFEQFRR